MKSSSSLLYLISLNSLTVQNGRADERVWIASKNGSFSVSSFFKAIINIHGERSRMYGIWKMESPPRVLVFGWLALRKRIPTMDLLRRRGM